MKRHAGRIVRNFGILSTLVMVLSLVGCATPTARNTPMDPYDLNRFVIDCRQKEQQTQFLLSLMNDGEDRHNAMLQNILMPWRVITDSNGYSRNTAMYTGANNYDIRQLLYLIKVNCG
jgi:hypothetical protein